MAYKVLQRTMLNAANDSPSSVDDPRSIPELIAAALAAPDDDALEEIAAALQARGDDEVFAAARNLCITGNSAERCLGVRILSQSLVAEKALRDKAVPVLLDLLQREQHPYVLCAIGMALGQLHDPRAVAPLARLKDHPISDVRYGVVQGLLCHEDELAIRTLIELSSDEDTDVRDWATFGLGSMIEVDTPEIRGALLARLGDDDGDTRLEALAGLAARKDERAIEPLIRELESSRASRVTVEAARDMGDTRLHPALAHLATWWDVDADLLAEALDSCKGRSE